MNDRRRAKSHAWHQRHVNDVYVRQAGEQGWRARSAFKLLEIDARDRLLRPGQVVVDLGCAPGGWCQVAVRRMQGQGRVIGVDLLEMPPLAGVRFIQGDFSADAVLARLKAELAGAGVDCVLSDMAPNLSGVAVADQARAYALAELALDFARAHLRPEGAFLIKVFQGAGFEDYMRSLRAAFRSVAVRKPDASRDRSREVYLLARGRLECRNDCIGTNAID